MRYRAWAVLGLLLLGLPGLSAEAAPPDRVPPRVRQRIQAEGAARVIVRLHLPGGAYTPESHLLPASVLRPPSATASCTCDHYAFCDHACHHRDCDPT